MELERVLTNAEVYAVVLEEHEWMTKTVLLRDGPEFEFRVYPAVCAPISQALGEWEYSNSETRNRTQNFEEEDMNFSKGIQETDEESEKTNKLEKWLECIERGMYTKELPLPEIGKFVAVNNPSLYKNLSPSISFNSVASLEATPLRPLPQYVLAHLQQQNIPAKKKFPTQKRNPPNMLDFPQTLPNWLKYPPSEMEFHSSILSFFQNSSPLLHAQTQGRHIATLTLASQNEEWRVCRVACAPPRVLVDFLSVSRVCDLVRKFADFIFSKKDSHEWEFLNQLSPFEVLQICNLAPTPSHPSLVLFYCAIANCTSRFSESQIEALRSVSNSILFKVPN